LKTLLKTSGFLHSVFSGPCAKTKQLQQQKIYRSSSGGSSLQTNRIQRENDSNGAIRTFDHELLAGTNKLFKLSSREILLSHEMGRG
jgi:hypothetical protein